MYIYKCYLSGSLQQVLPYIKLMLSITQGCAEVDGAVLCELHDVWCTIVCHATIYKINVNLSSHSLKLYIY